eukprot:6482219-Amphidinium_carterae.2
MPPDAMNPVPLLPHHQVQFPILTKVVHRRTRPVPKASSFSSRNDTICRNLSTSALISSTLLRLLNATHMRM